ncbi:TPA: protein phosphatase 2A 48 kDa regulatory subunit-like, partial [Bos taurus]
MVSLCLLLQTAFVPGPTHPTPGPSAAVVSLGQECHGGPVGAVSGFWAHLWIPAKALHLPEACGCPLYWKGPLFCSAGGERTGSVSVHKFVAMWRKVLQNCHDDAAKFVHLLVSPGCSYLVQEDFVPFLQDVVNTHPGLAFLKEAAEFHSRYITTVIQRIFYTVNRSWSGRITCAELRRSTFLQ